MSVNFVVSTGRCGSTMLSRLLHLNQHVLSLSEFFAALQSITRSPAFPTGEMDGRGFWRLLASTDHALAARARAGLAPESRYPYGRGRFDLSTGVPAVANTTLPSLTDDPDTLFDELAGQVPAWPRRAAGEHYREFFKVLCALLGRDVVVERSGGSLILLPAFRTQFPEARFVHMHRDGADCALSMSRHPGIRISILVATAKKAAGVAESASWREFMDVLPQQFDGLLAPPFDAERLMSYDIPLTDFGERWSRTVCDGLKVLSGLPADAWTSLKYEHLLRDPESELARVAEFIGVPTTVQWLRLAGGLVRKHNAGTAEAQLDRRTLAALRAACEPGMHALAAMSR